MMYRTMVYGFPEAVLAPGEERTLTVDIKGLFRAEKLVMVATMKEIRGHFRIKRSRLPLLNRDDVISFSRIRKWSNGKIVKYLPGKTVVAYQSKSGGFIREYLPSSVVYKHTDALSYIQLKQLFVGKEPQMAGGVAARFFGANSFGNAIPAPSTEVGVTLVLKNEGDVQVRVRATMLGMGLSVDTGVNGSIR